jgi:type IV pilus assembly protein PilM
VISISSKSGGRPKLACEISPDRILAARVSDKGRILADCATCELAPGSVLPDLLETNLPQRQPIRDAIEHTLSGISEGLRDVIAVLPDAAVRVVMLDFEMLPNDPAEAESVVRFRLKKSLPFDVDKAKVSYHVQASGAGVKVVAAVALSSVLEDYETAFREAGYSPGVVLPSTLAALGAAEAGRPTLVVKVDANTTSIVILDQNQVLLFRTLENARGVRITDDQLAEEVYPSVVFFQDTYHLNIEQILIAGLSADGAAPALRAQTGAEVRELVSSSHMGVASGHSVPRWRLAGVVGALVS